MNNLNNITASVFTSVNTGAGKTAKALHCLQEHISEQSIPESNVIVFDLTTNLSGKISNDLKDIIGVVVKRSLSEVFLEVQEKKPLAIVINNLQTQCNRKGGSRSHEDNLLKNLSSIFQVMSDSAGDGKRAAVFATAKITDNSGNCNKELQRMLSVFPNSERLGADQRPFFLED